LLVTYRFSELHPDDRSAMKLVMLKRTTDPKEIQALQTIRGGRKADWKNVFERLADDEAVLLPDAKEAHGELRRFTLAPRLTSHIRHRSKYLDVPIASGHEFVFTSGMGKPQPGLPRTWVRNRCAASYELSAFTSRLYRLPSPSVTVTVHHFPMGTA
jgi:hypothetical protein